MATDPAAEVAALVDAGLARQDSGDNPAAIPLYQQAIALAEQRLGRGHAWLARACYELGTLHLAESRDEGAPLLERALAIWDAGAPTTDPRDDERIAVSRAMLAHRAGRLDEELRHLTDAAMALERILPPRDGETLAAWEAVASAQWATDQRDDALATYRRTATAYEDDPGHEFAGRAVADHAWCLHELGRTAEADALYARRLEVTRVRCGGSHPAVDRLLGWQASALAERGDKEGALVAHEAAHAARLARLADGDTDVFGEVGTLRGLHEEAGRLGDEERLLRELREAALRHLPIEHDAVRDATDRHANFFARHQRWDESREPWRELLERRQAALPADHVAVALAILGFDDSGPPSQRFQELELLARAADTFERVCTFEDDHRVSSALGALRIAYAHHRRWDEQHVVSARLVAWWRKRLAPARPEIGGWGLDDLARELSRFGRSAEAVRGLEEALVLVEERLGGGHPSAAQVHSLIADAIEDLESEAREPALDHRRRAIEILRAAEDNHDNRWQLHRSLAELARHFQSRDRHDEAIAVLRERVTLVDGMTEEESFRLDARRELGEALRRGGRREDATAALGETSARARSGDKPSWAGAEAEAALFEMALEDERWTAALAHVDRWLALRDPSDEEWNRKDALHKLSRLGVAAADRGEDRVAQQALERSCELVRLLDRHPDAELHLKLAELAIRQKRPDDARAHYEVVALRGSRNAAQDKANRRRLARLYDALQPGRPVRPFLVAAARRWPREQRPSKAKLDELAAWIQACIDQPAKPKVKPRTGKATATAKPRKPKPKTSTKPRR